MIMMLMVPAFLACSCPGSMQGVFLGSIGWVPGEVITAIAHVIKGVDLLTAASAGPSRELCMRLLWAKLELAGESVE